MEPSCPANINIALPLLYLHLSYLSLSFIILCYPQNDILIMMKNRMDRQTGVYRANELFWQFHKFLFQYNLYCDFIPFVILLLWNMLLQKLMEALFISLTIVIL